VGSVRAASVRPGGSAAVVLVAVEHLASASGTALHLKLGALHLHRHLRAIHLRRLDKLVRLQEARPNIAS
jgi:hypothetical protein